MRRRFWSNVLAVAYKEARVMRHDRVLVSTVLIQPVVMCLLFGGALSNQPRNVDWLVLDRSRTTVSRRFLADLQATGYFRVPTAVGSYDDGIRRMRRAEALAFVVVPSDFARTVDAGRAEAQLLVDGSDPIAAARIGAAVGLAARAFRPDRDGGALSAPIEVRQRFRFNPTLDDSRFYLSILAAILLTNLCLSASSLGLVGERERGTYEQMLALPTTVTEIVLGKLVPYVGVSYVVLVLALLLAGVLFGYWPAGNVGTLALVALPFVVASLAVGTFVSAISRTSAQAVFISVFFIMPSFVLSGMMMPYQFMPHPVREIGGLTPARWFQIAARRIVARGGGLEDVLVPLLVLSTFVVAMLALVRWRLKPRLD